jgi:hypothetical protein
MIFGARSVPIGEETTMSGHKYKIGQTVNYVSRIGYDRASGTYEVKELLPPEGDAFQYRIKNASEPYERVAKEHELRRPAA